MQVLAGLRHYACSLQAEVARPGRQRAARGGSYNGFQNASGSGRRHGQQRHQQRQQCRNRHRIAVCAAGRSGNRGLGAELLRSAVLSSINVLYTFLQHTAYSLTHGISSPTRAEASGAGRTQSSPRECSAAVAMQSGRCPCLRQIADSYPWRTPSRSVRIDRTAAAAERWPPCIT
jgi:hypothetical protein